MLHSTSFCKANYRLSVEVREFMERVRGVKEESITDFLVWRWGELDERFKYLTVTPFDRDEESSTTGADFDLELWLVGRTFHASLSVQAKKFIPQNGSYVRKLRYPNNTKAQMNTLLAYSKAKQRSPFYFIYTVPEVTTKHQCHRLPGPQAGGVFMADAFTIEDFADGKHGNRVSRDNLLSVAKPFHCLFCCPLAADGDYLSHYFPRVRTSARGDMTDLPSYVNRLLESSEVDRQSVVLEEAERESLRAYRHIGVYDMRGDRS